MTRTTTTTHRNLVPRDKPAPSNPPRRWQGQAAAAVADAAAEGRNTFFVSAGVGAGKSMMAMLAYLAGPFDLFIVVVPKTGIRSSWADDAKLLGLRIETIEDGRRAPALERVGGQHMLPHGYVLTAPLLVTHARKGRQQQAEGELQPDAPLVRHLKTLCQDAGRVLVIVDEAHHVAGDLAWKAAMADALGGAAFHLAMSGTPYRTDEKQILALDYAAQGAKLVGTPTHDYSYEQALADGHVAPIECRFIGGTVIRHTPGDGAVDVFRWSDEYLTPRGEPDLKRMGERLVLSAVACAEWQQGAIAEARSVLEGYRRDGGPWAGLIACATVEQARLVQEHIQARYGDCTRLIVGDVATEPAVEEVNSDTSIRWVISITKISEGVSIKRLRVGLLLSNYTTKAFLDQLKGRLSRTFDGVAYLDQPCTFLMPADPRNIEFAQEANRTLLHEVPWLRPQREDESDEAYAEAIVRERDALADEPVLADMDAAEAARYIEKESQRIAGLRQRASRAPGVIDIGEVRLYGSAVLEGAALDGQFYTEDEWKALRETLVAQGLDPFRARLYGAEAMQALVRRAQA